MIDPKNFQVQESQIDKSVNFIFPDDKEGSLEARFVQRSPDYYCCYLSSHTGCNKGCKFCHLTATKQTMYRPALKTELFYQAIKVYNHACKVEQKNKRVQVNFMARGEALDNPVINGEYLQSLSCIFEDSEHIRVNISTIMPRSIKDQNLAARFLGFPPILYYSLWSVDEEWRQKWMPSAMPIEDAYQILVAYQQTTGTIIKIHGAFIEGENDGEQFQKMLQLLEDWSKNLLFTFNLVRYNPFSSEYGQEADLSIIQEELCSKGISNRILERVGSDVKCSCGQFVTMT